MDTELDRIAADIGKRLSSMSTKKLQELARAAGRANETNCWWLTYEISRPIFRIAEAYLVSAKLKEQLSKKVDR